MNETTFIGKITKSHGLKGEVMFVLDDNSIRFSNQIKLLLLAKKNAIAVPYFIQSFQIRPTGILIKFESINSPNEAKSIVHTDVFSEEKYLEKKENEIESENYSNPKYTGFELHDKNFGIVGKIKMTLNFPGQTVFSIEHSAGAEILLPANKTMIEKISEKEKIIYYNAPEGLIEMYISIKKTKTTNQK